MPLRILPLFCIRVWDYPNKQNGHGPAGQKGPFFGSVATLPMLATLVFLISSIYKNPLDKKTTSCYILTVNTMLYIKEDETWYSKFPTPNLKL